MKSFFSLLLFISSLILTAQHKQNLGVSIGFTQFTSQSEAFNTKDTDGLTIGLTGNFVFTRRSELSVELRYNRHIVIFETLDADKDSRQDLDLILKQVEVPLTYTFNVLASKNFNLGLNAGASANFFHEYNAEEEAQEEFLLRPSNIVVNNLFFDTRDEKIGLNFYLIGGLSIRILKHFLFTGRYYHGLSNPYRQAPPDNPVSNFEAEVSYKTLTFTYFF